MVLLCWWQKNCFPLYHYQVEGFKMNLIYYDLYQSTRLEKFITGMVLPSPIYKPNYCEVWTNGSFLPIAAYATFLKASGETPVTWKRAATMDEVLQEADIVRIWFWKF